MSRTETRSPSSFHSQAVARNLERVAWLMDRAVTIPGTKISFGLDALIGLLPVGGDVLTGFVQAALVLVALQHYRVPKTVAVRMMANVLIDIAVGAVPLVGDLFDVAFKANTRNLQLLEPYRHVEVIDVTPQPGTTSFKTVLHQARGTSWRYLVPIAIAFVAALALMIVGFVTVVRWLLR